MSHVTVLAELGDSTEVKTRDGTCRVYQITPREVIKGNLPADRPFAVTGLDDYYIPQDMAAPATAGRLLRATDWVYLFLVPKDQGHYAMYRLAPADWSVIESGVRLLAGDHVYDFRQQQGFDRKLPAPMGDFFTVTPANYPEIAVPTQAAFAQDLKDSFAVVTRVNGLVANSRPDRLGDYIRFLTDRAVAPSGGRDKLDARIALEVSQYAPARVRDDLRVHVSPSAAAVLRTGLTRLDAREYVLERAGDPQEPAERRFEYANILQDSAWQCFRDCRDGKVDKPDFATRVAKLAAANLGTKTLVPLLSTISSCGHTTRDFLRPSSMVPDLKQAAGIIAAAYPAASTKDGYRLAETLMLIDADAFHKLLPSAGPMLTLLEPLPEFPKALRNGELRMAAAFRNLIPPNAPAAQVRLVIRSLSTGEEISVPGRNEIAGLRSDDSQGQFGEMWLMNVPVHKELARGRYLLFLRCTIQGKEMGDGLGFEAALD